MGKYDERIDELAAGRRRPRLAFFPFMGDGQVPVGVRLLSNREISKCRSLAANWANQQAEPLKVSSQIMVALDGQILDDEILRRMIYLAFVEPDSVETDGPYPLFFKSPEQVAELDAITVRALHEVYLQHQEDMSPVRGLDERQREEFLDALGKGFADPSGPSIGQRLITLDAATLRQLLVTSVSRRATSTTGS